MGRQLGGVIAPAIGGGGELAVRYDLMHEAELERLPGLDVAAGDVELERTLVAKPPRQRPAGPDLREQTESAESGNQHRPL
jgi:hypothetical protein